MLSAILITAAVSVLLTAAFYELELGRQRVDYAIDELQQLETVEQHFDNNVLPIVRDQPPRAG